MSESISTLVLLIFVATTVATSLLLWGLWRFRHYNARGFFQLAILLLSFFAIVAEQFLVYQFPSSWGYVNRATTWMPLLFGPCLWLFCLSLAEVEKLTSKSIFIHYLPAILCLVYFLPYLLSSPQDKAALRSFSLPFETNVLAAIKIISLSVYLGLAYRRLNYINQRLNDVMTQGLKRVLQLFAVVIVLAFVAFVAESQMGQLWVPADIIAAIGLWVTIYFSVFGVISGWAKFVSVLPNCPVDTKSDCLGVMKSDCPEPKQLLEKDEVQAIYRDIVQQMHLLQLFTQNDIKSDTLANALGLPVHYLSFVVNQGFGDNIQNWLNHFRVECFKMRLKNKPDSPLLQLALSCGFNSKATFNRAFKQFTGQTPSQYRVKILKINQ